jgi:hypothetical protein
VSQSQSESVISFRVERMRRAPRNWTYWVAFFTFLNGLFLLIGQDILILAGLIAPFLLPTASSHFIAAAVFAALAYFSSRLRALLAIGLVIYIADTLLAAYLGLWSGFVMHVVVLALVGIALSVARRLARQLASQAQGGDA